MPRAARNATVVARFSTGRRSTRSLPGCRPEITPGWQFRAAGRALDIVRALLLLYEGEGVGTPNRVLGRLT